MVIIQKHVCTVVNIHKATSKFITHVYHFVG